jgi:Fe-S-cluster containining protein
MSDCGSAGSATVNVEAKLGDYNLKFSVSVPAGPTRLDDLMPLLQILSDHIVEVAENEAHERGRCISCRKGCGACCRQLVPLSPVEARHVARLVRELPEPRRSEIIGRFAAARRTLEDAGIWERLLHRREWHEDTSTQIGLEYFRLAVACPFLEDESCSIHLDRPMTCREYLVTSPAEYCADPKPGSIEGLPLAAKVWVAAARCEPVTPGTEQFNWVPLIQALDWAAENPEPPAEKTGPEVLRQVVDGLGRSGCAQAHSAASPALLPLIQN